MRRSVAPAGGRPADEPFGVDGEGGVEDGCPGGVGLLGEAVVDGGWGHQPDPGVAMLVVVSAGVSESAGRNRHGAGDERALHRRSSDPR